MSTDKIRNFCIIAHIDHGKSTLADRMMEITGTVEKRQMKAQLLDSMELEREKGITIKLTPVQMHYKGYELNLIDTPGHVDFSYEVSRSLQAVETAVLVVDATQGIQAQTLANVYLALEQDLFIIPVINKIDLPAADVEKVSAQITNLLGCKKEDIIGVSAKTGLNVEKVLDAIIERGINVKHSHDTDKTRALIFDSYFDDYRGVVLYVRVFNGSIPKNSSIHMMANHTDGLALEVGALTPNMSPKDSLEDGEIGYIVTNLKTTREAKVGDTVTLQPENSPVLGFGLRIGFLGLLHMDIIRERLEREFNLDLVVTNPSTNYEVTLNNGEELEIKSAADLPDLSLIKEIREPWVKGEIILPQNMIGNVLKLINEKRGHQTNLSYIEDRAVIDFEAPMANLLTDFYDQLKSVTSGYASFNYELANYRAEDLVRVDFLVSSQKIDALAIMCHRTEADAIGREVTKKLKQVIPRQNFEVALQAAIGSRILARETIGAYRKDVTVKIHTGDRDRKAKLLDKQKRGKARMKRFGKIDIPSEAFTVMLKRDD